MKKLLILLFCLFLPTQLFAEIITLTSGKTVEGKIIEKTSRFIKVDVYGVILTYDFNEIQKIEDNVEVIVVNEPPKTSKPSKNPSESDKQEKSATSVEPTKEEKELAAWNKWYTTVQPYIQKVKQLINDAGTETMPIFEQIKITKNRIQKRQLIQLMGNKLIPYIQAFQNLQPPNGLERWHQLQIQAIEQMRFIADAEAKGNPSIAQNYANQLSVIEAEAAKELRNVLIAHKAPQEIINGLAPNK